MPEPDAPLHNRIVRTVLYLLSALAPYTIRTVNSVADKSQLPHDWLGDSGQGSPRPKILIPIHIPPQTSATVGHWILVVLDANIAQLLDPNPSDFHRQLAKETVQALSSDRPSFQPAWTSVGEIEWARSGFKTVDGGVFVLVRVIDMAAATFGSPNRLPSAINSELWRDILSLLLKLTMGHESRLAWAERLGRSGLLPEGEGVELSKKAIQMFRRLDSETRSYKDAHGAITRTHQLLVQQQTWLGNIEAELREKRAATAREGGSIRMILESRVYSRLLRRRSGRLRNWMRRRRNGKKGSAHWIGWTKHQQSLYLRIENNNFSRPPRSKSGNASERSRRVLRGGR